MRKYFKVFFLGVAFFILASTLSGCNNNQGDTLNTVLAESEIQSIDITIEVVTAETESIEYLFEDIKGKTVFNILQEYKNNDENFTFEHDEFEGLGAYVTAINGKEADESSFWVFKINDEDSQVGVSEYVVNENVKLTFELTFF